MFCIPCTNAYTVKLFFSQHFVIIGVFTRYSVLLAVAVQLCFIYVAGCNHLDAIGQPLVARHMTVADISGTDNAYS